MKSKAFKSVLVLFIALTFVFSFISIFSVSAAEKTGYITKDIVRVRTSPTSKIDTNKLMYNGSNVLLNTGDIVKVIETVDSDGDSDFKKWCHIRFDYLGASLEGYVASDFVQINEEEDTTGESTTGGITELPDTPDNPELEVSTDIPDIYKSYVEEIKKLHPNWQIVVYDTGYEWSELFTVENQSYLQRSVVPSSYPVSYRSTASGCYDWATDRWIAQDAGNWYQANVQTIAYYMDPRNFMDEKSIFMFEKLSYDPSTHTIDGVQKILNGSFMESTTILNLNGNRVTYAQAYIDAAMYSKVNPYHLASRTIQEVGRNGSGSTSGTHSSYPGYYNYYNIGATAGTSPISNGLRFAKTGGSMSQTKKELCMIPWNTPYKAIVGGGYWIGANYINSVHNQCTLYFQKFNTSNPDSAYFYHQYMGNVLAPALEAPRVYNTYNELGMIENDFIFIIPYYHNMPEEACQLPESSNASPNNWLKSLEIEGFEDLITFKGSTTEYTCKIPSEIDEINIVANTVNANATVTGAGTVNVFSEENIFYIDVTAENGDVRTYKLTVTKDVEEKVPVESLIIDKTEVSMNIGDSDKLNVTFEPFNTTDSHKILWTSSDNSIVSVSDTGEITALSAGTAIITAKMGELSVTCQVTVIDIPIESISINKSEISMYINETETLEVIFKPTNTTADKTVEWSSSNPSIVDVDKNGTLIPKSYGTATITARVGEHTATCKVTVIFVQLNSISLDKTELSLFVGEKSKLNVIYNPSNTSVDKTVVWTSSNENIVTVANDGTITAKDAGQATVKAKVGNKTVSCVITVSHIDIESVAINIKELTLFKGNTEVLSVIINPANATVDTTVIWSSSDNSIVEVDETGIITAKSAGVATITAKVGSHTVSCIVTVNDYMVGDINGNGKVEIADALLIFKHKSGEIVLDANALLAADTDKNGKVEIADALRIFKYKSGEISAEEFFGK